MANLMDYLDWRGDLTLEISPFNEVDALILAELSFVDFDGIVPPPELGRGLPLNEAAEAFFARHGGKDVPMGVLVPDTISKMLTGLARTWRQGDGHDGGCGREGRTGQDFRQVCNLAAW